MDDSDHITFREILWLGAVAGIVAAILGTAVRERCQPWIDDEQPVSPTIIDAPWMD